VCKHAKLTRQFGMFALMFSYPDQVSRRWWYCITHASHAQ